MLTVTHPCPLLGWFGFGDIFVGKQGKDHDADNRPIFVVKIFQVVARKTPDPSL